MSLFKILVHNDLLTQGKSIVVLVVEARKTVNVKNQVADNMGWKLAFNVYYTVCHLLCSRFSYKFEGENLPYY